jgi:hypothetical protein
MKDEQVKNIDTLIDQFVAVSLIIHDELLTAEAAGIHDLFDCREQCLAKIQSELDQGAELTVIQRRRLADSDRETGRMIDRAKSELRREAGHSDRERSGRQTYKSSATPVYDLTG